MPIDHNFIDCVFDPSDLVEIRVLPSKQQFYVRVDQINSLESQIQQANDNGQNIFVGANPRKRKGGKAEDVALARCLFVDMDNTCTDKAVQWIADAGMPEPSCLINSGHGVHVYWRLTEPMEDLVAWTEAQKQLIYQIGSDPLIHDSPRVMRLPGFTNHKEPAALCQLIHTVDKQRINNRQLVLGDRKDPSQIADHWLQKALNRAKRGNRNDTGLWLACQLRDAGLNQFQAEAALHIYTSHQETDYTEQEATASVRSAYSRPPRQPAIGLGKPVDKDSRESLNREPILTCLADVKSEPIRWLWRNRIALSKLTLVAGDPGLGKSLVTIDIAARISKGAGWPDLPDENSKPGGVVLLSAEDDLADTVRPRLDVAGADVSQIVALEAIKHRDPDSGDEKKSPFCLTSDLPALEHAIKKTSKCCLVIIDPISAYLSGTDSHKNTDIRAVLAPLSDLAAEYKVAVVAVTHLRKGDGPAIYRAMGSLAFVAASRTVFCVCQDQNEDSGSRRFVLPVKNNIVKDGTGLAYSVKSSNTIDLEAPPMIAWEADPVTISADMALAQGRSSTDGYGALDEAVEWLRCHLADGPVKAADVKENAKGDGVGSRTLDRAKKKLGVIAAPDDFRGPWVWRLPDSPTERQSATESTQCATPETLAHCGQSGALCDQNHSDKIGDR